MQLHIARGEGNHIAAAGAEPGREFVVVGGADGGADGGAKWTRGVIVLPERTLAWPAASAAEVCAARLRTAAEIAPPPEVVLLGTSRERAWPNPEWLALFAAKGLGLEVMTLAAACRTYNILAADGRRVAAALTLGG